MERGLFRNDFRAQQRTEETADARPMGEHALQLADKPDEANATQATQVTIEGMRAILVRQDYRCALSGVVLSPDCASLDHIQPLSRGGKHILSNIQIIHPVVNALKGQMMQEDFIEWVNLIASNIKEDTGFGCQDR